MGWQGPCVPRWHLLHTVGTGEGGGLRDGVELGVDCGAAAQGASVAHVLHSRTYVASTKTDSRAPVGLTYPQRWALAGRGRHRRRHRYARRDRHSGRWGGRDGSRGGRCRPAASAHTYACTHTNTRVHAHTHACTYTHARARTHTRVHAHTHTHTHASTHAWTAGGRFLRSPD
jgi:hypothetical protein